MTYTPLSRERRSTISTREAAHHLNRAVSTLHGWAREGGPVMPIRMGKRLAWPVSEIKRVVKGRVRRKARRARKC